MGCENMSETTVTMLSKAKQSKAKQSHYYIFIINNYLTYIIFANIGVYNA